MLLVYSLLKVAMKAHYLYHLVPRLLVAAVILLNWCTVLSHSSGRLTQAVVLGDGFVSSGRPCWRTAMHMLRLCRRVVRP